MALRHVKIISPSIVIEDAYIVIKEGLILDVGSEPLSNSPATNINLEGYYAIPGFIDTHTHGAKGIEVTDASVDDIFNLSEFYITKGVTSFLPTTVSAPHETLVKTCRAINEAINAWKPAYGSRILGVHLEGPYLNPEAAGAQNLEALRKPDLREFEEYMKASGGFLRQITLAPELEGAMDLISYAVSRKIVVSAGHSNATYEEGLKAIERGVSKANHLFNGMRRFHHRDPGIALALLLSSNVYLEIIADFVHLHPAVVKLVVDYAKPNRVVLITDSISATGLPDGIYKLGGLEIVVHQGVSRLVKTGSLAGSTLTLDTALRNMVSLGYDLKSVVSMLSLVPARSIKEEKIGDIKPGYFADIVILDEKLSVTKTLVAGEIVFEK
jgi:N-acetylglucosamine-6-phosphate deacetylase